MAGGNYSPTAVDVARAAGTTVRTLFRHYSSLDELYATLNDHLRKEANAIVRTVVSADNLHDRLAQMVSRRRTVFEALLPYTEFQYVNRHQSRYLRDSHKAGLHESRLLMMAALTGYVDFAEPRFDALQVILSPSHWRLLRQDLEKSADETQELILLNALALYPENTFASPPNLLQETD